MAPRAMAGVAFGITHGACQWHGCMLSNGILKRLRGTELHTCGLDLVLAEWWLSHSVPFDAMLTEPPLELRGVLPSGVCAWDTNRMGLITVRDAAFPECRRHSHTYEFLERTGAHNQPQTTRIDNT